MNILALFKVLYDFICLFFFLVLKACTLFHFAFTHAKLAHEPPAEATSPILSPPPTKIYLYIPTCNFFSLSSFCFVKFFYIFSLDFFFLFFDATLYFSLLVSLFLSVRTCTHMRINVALFFCFFFLYAYFFLFIRAYILSLFCART